MKKTAPQKINPTLALAKAASDLSKSVEENAQERRSKKIAEQKPLAPHLAALLR